MLPRMLAFTLAATSLAHAQTPLCDHIQTLTQDPTVSAAHWGVQVSTLDGVSLCAIHAAQLFRPASNAKLFTTAAALALLGPNATVSTTALAAGSFPEKDHLKGNLILVGEGDANLSGRTFPYAPDTDEATPALRALEAMADQIAQTGLHTIDGDIVGAGDHLAFQPYADGWSFEDLVWGYGAPVSALSVNDNQLELTITPSTELGSRALLSFVPGVPYYTVINEVMTTDAKSPAQIAIDRMPGSKTLRVYGGIAFRSAPEIDHVAIDDPPEFAAIALKQMLERRGITVTGRAYAEHVPLSDPRGLRQVTQEPFELKKPLTAGTSNSGSSSLYSGACVPGPYPHAVPLASHTSPTLLEDVIVTNKESLNLHAELLLRRLAGRFVPSDATSAQGVRVVRQFLLDSGIPGSDFTFADGSGLSTYDLVTPRAVVALLTFAGAQPWGSAFKSSLPVGGVDGTLAHRFTSTLKGRVFAKTGTHSEARALSGYVLATSGKTLIFSILVDNHLPGSNADRTIIDKIVETIAEAS